MPRKKVKETPEQQAERFERSVREMVDAGELSPTEADAQFERAIAAVARLREDWFELARDQENPDSEP